MNADITFQPALSEYLLICCCDEACSVRATVKILVRGEWRGYACCEDERHCAQAVEGALEAASEVVS